MIKLEVKTKLSREEMAERLKRFFGKGGLGLEMTEETEQCLHFEGGGYVSATICTEHGKMRLEFVTQEWDFHVRRFASELP